MIYGIKKSCINCLCVEHGYNNLSCIIHDKPVSVDDVCDQWNPDRFTELHILRKENEELKAKLGV